jgi:hypothetical protein
LAETAVLTVHSPAKLAKFDKLAQENCGNRDDAPKRAATGRAAREAAMSMADYWERARSMDVSRPANAAAITLMLPDPGADDRRRKVELSRRQVIFRRTIGGVAVHVQLPISAFCGIALCVVETDRGEAGFAVRLVHSDPDKCIQLAHGDAEATVIDQ